MATTKPKIAGKTAAEKARAIAAVASWLALGLETKQPTAATLRAIDVAYDALRLFSETAARIQVCALLQAEAEGRGSHISTSRSRPNFVRSFIATIKNGDEFKLVTAAGEATDATIEAAVAAWARGPGQRSGGAPDRWTATARLLRESGFGTVDPNALRLSWQRRKSEHGGRDHVRSSAPAVRGKV